MRARLLCIGEPLAEISETDGALTVAYGGDSMNTAIYAKRCFAAQGDVAYLTAVGTDPLSRGFLALTAAEDIDTTHVQISNDRNIGIYSISNDAHGERSFHYWREQSAARAMFQMPDDPAFAAFVDTDIIYLSGISIAILTPVGRENLRVALIAAQKHGTRVAFDSNYRPGLWEDITTARRVTQQFWDIAQIALPTIDDEFALYGDTSPAGVLARLASQNSIGALKCGADGPLAIGASAIKRNYPVADKVVDTTGAGDSFNGAFLAGIMRGYDTGQAIADAHAQAMKVIGHKGAILPR